MYVTCQLVLGIEAQHIRTHLFDSINLFIRNGPKSFSRRRIISIYRRPLSIWSKQSRKLLYTSCIFFGFLLISDHMILYPSHKVCRQPHDHDMCGTGGIVIPVTTFDKLILDSMDRNLILRFIEHYFRCLGQSWEPYSWLKDIIGCIDSPLTLQTSVLRSSILLNFCKIKNNFAYKWMQFPEKKK